MNCPCCAIPIETRRIAAVDFDICHSCLGVWLPIQATTGIVAARGMNIDQFMVMLLDRLKKIEKGEFTDKLTGLGNRKFFDRQLLAEIARARGSHFLSLILLDLDGFKAANDDFGHATGDFVLKEFGGLLDRVIRKSDCAARAGGDEFALILPETEVVGAKAIANRVVKETAEYEFCALDGAPIANRIRVSCGVACYPMDFIGNGESDGRARSHPASEPVEPVQDVEELRRRLFDLADAALYAAKDRGRGMAVCADELSNHEREKHILVRDK
jgi:diguanylate cyclase (GGDEF)-like protein